MEAIEAKWLFDVEMDQIEILIHPQSIIHSMVEYMDGSIIAQLASPDMRIPISYALSYPRHLKGELASLDLSDIGTLSFGKPDRKRFRYLYTSDIPDPDFLIRTSGEYRISNFLLWQIAYTEIFITPTLWPDFHRERYLEALLDYQKRERRFGSTGEQANHPT